MIDYYNFLYNYISNIRKNTALTYVCVFTDPASQWYRGGTERQLAASAVMAPASNTPKPNKWLNSNPTPFIVQWKRPCGVNNLYIYFPFGSLDTFQVIIYMSYGV